MWLVRHYRMCELYLIKEKDEGYLLTKPLDTNAHTHKYTRSNTHTVHTYVHTDINNHETFFVFYYRTYQFVATQIDVMSKCKMKCIEHTSLRYIIKSIHLEYIYTQV